MSLLAQDGSDQAATVAQGNVDELPQASLMGIAVELRLRIYSFLLAGDGKALCGSKHCCTRPIPSNDDDDTACTPTLIRCTCASRTWPEILAVNKQVFSEAMPVLYNNLEMRITLPMLWPHTTSASASFEDALNSIPGYGYSHVRRIVVVGSYVITAIKIFDEDPEIAHLRWDFLVDRLPNIKNIRLHFDVFTDWLDDLDSLDYDQLAGLSCFPRLSAVKLETYPIDCCDNRTHVGSSITISRELAARIRDKANSLAKDLSVIIDGHLQNGDYEGPDESE